jgi:hypothetical protein
MNRWKWKIGGGKRIKEEHRKMRFLFSHKCAKVSDEWRHESLEMES